MNDPFFAETTNAFIWLFWMWLGITITLFIFFGPWIIRGARMPEPPAPPVQEAPPPGPSPEQQLKQIQRKMRIVPRKRTLSQMP